MTKWRIGFYWQTPWWKQPIGFVRFRTFERPRNPAGTRDYDSLLHVLWFHWRIYREAK